MPEANTTVQKSRSHLFGPGNCANPKGRPKGSKSKLATNFVDDLYEDWQGNGRDAIKRCRETNVAAYLNVIVKIIPQDVTVTHKTVFDEMDTHDIVRLVDALSAESARLAGRSAGPIIEAEAVTLQAVPEAEIVS